MLYLMSPGLPNNILLVTSKDFDSYNRPKIMVKIIQEKNVKIGRKKIIHRPTNVEI